MNLAYHITGPSPESPHHLLGAMDRSYCGLRARVNQVTHICQMLDLDVRHMCWLQNDATWESAMLRLDESRTLLNQTPSGLHVGDPASLLYQCRQLDKYKQIDAEHDGMSFSAKETTASPWV